MHNINHYIYEIQHKYLKLLQKSIADINSNNVRSIFDNILVFWHSHRRTILLYLNSIDHNDQAYLFTGASYLRVVDNNHYPFTSLGKIHIIDDALCKLAKSFHAIVENKFNNSNIQHIIDTINDNIEIIEKYKNYIIIIPVTFGFIDEKVEIQKSTINNFLHLFNNEFTSIEDYASKITTIEDIYGALKDEHKNSLPISDTSPFENGLISCFNDFKKSLPPQLTGSKSDSYLFFMHISGLLNQAIDILLCCTKFALIPYIRSKTCFYYTSITATSFPEIPILKDINFHMTSAYLLYKSFPEDLTNIEFERYYTTIKNLNVFKNRLEPLLLAYINTSELSLIDIQEELYSCFADLEIYFKDPLAGK